MAAIDQSDTLTAMAKRMGATVSDLADAKPWPAESVAAYAEKHGKRSDPIGYQHLSDVQVASAVRMLMRYDLDHEGVVCAARDRICALHMEKASLLEALRRIAAGAHATDTRQGLRSDGTRGDIPRYMGAGELQDIAKGAITKAEGRS